MASRVLWSVYLITEHICFTLQLVVVMAGIIMIVDEIVTVKSVPVTEEINLKHISSLGRVPSSYSYNRILCSVE